MGAKGHLKSISPWALEALVAHPLLVELFVVADPRFADGYDLDRPFSSAVRQGLSGWRSVRSPAAQGVAHAKRRYLQGMGRARSNAKVALDVQPSSREGQAGYSGRQGSRQEPWVRTCAIAQGQRSSYHIPRAGMDFGT
jgi:hypothetical protein